MSGWNEAVERLRAGRAIALADEGRDGVAHLLAAGPEALPVLLREGRGPLTVVGGGEAVPPATGGLDVLLHAPRAGGTLVLPTVEAAAQDLAAAAAPGRAALLRAAALPGGVLARDGAVQDFAARLGLATLSIQDVVTQRLATETIVEEVAAATLPSLYSDQPLAVHAFRGLLDGTEHLALVRRPGGTGPLGPAPLVRLHSECLTGDALGSLRCDCGEQLRSALKLIVEDPQGGAVVYLRGQEGRGIGLANKIRAYALQERGLDTVEANTELGFPADMRDYGVAVQILKALGIGRLRLLSNNPRKRAALERYGIAVAERRGLRIGPNPHNATYLETKRLKLGHDLSAAGLKVASEP
ncbi:GTP cyclohydrolase II [Lichenibacterium ramalinae]|uniref:GTP cyclohydrolase-2 n=1 Tax=Lichenibacterium ramalinae TaxID=2316527 RepID=A0A4Q2RH96_9HYPH|nr:GTP cyclohydrolase II [Lichenibacterium ramalinae]RYB05283.1 GTP cyclohydrolase II [Lichenibacterium ramalinae]